ncbi:MAG: ATP-binding protein [Helicobacteraceae bacterium]|jgi:two-component sensor histidine kinase|nr:ATP-binding protein [Helicobacteraceae bacterium]
MRQHLLALLLFFMVSASAGLEAKNVDVFSVKQQLLSHSSVYLDRENRTFDEVIKQHFSPYDENHINLSFDAETAVWVELTLVNSGDELIERILEIGNPLLEKVVLFEDSAQQEAGMLQVAEDQHHLNPSFLLTFMPQESKTIWLRIENKTTALQFDLHLKSVDRFYHDDLMSQYTITIFLGIILAFLMYALLLFVYTKDRSYLFYTLYLSTLLFQQMTYVGFLPLHAPLWFTAVDDLIVVPKVAMMIIAAAWFAQSFLKTQQYKRVHRTYNLIVLFLFIQMPLVGTPWFYLPELTVLTGLAFIIFNTCVGLYVYRQGNKQARFFIAGWAVLIIAYLLMIFDAMGVISVMYFLPNLVMWATALEAMFLLLAFVDRLSILQQQKEKLDRDLIHEYSSRQEVIEHEVVEKTAELSSALAQKELLFKELHHRVKNNLQLILSLMRLQNDTYECDKENTFLQQLEGRIRAIARTHEMLYQNNEAETVDMEEYVERYIDELKNSMPNDKMIFESAIEASLPLKKAVYVGLVINELVSNTLKHAYGEAGGRVYIALKLIDNRYVLEVADEGIGYDPQETRSKSLGLILVKSLVEEQLEGSLTFDNSNGSHYIMRFSL